MMPMAMPSISPAACNALIVCTLYFGPSHSRIGDADNW